MGQKEERHTESSIRKHNTREKKSFCSLALCLSLAFQEEINNYNMSEIFVQTEKFSIAIRLINALDADSLTGILKRIIARIHIKNEQIFTTQVRMNDLRLLI